MATASEVCLPTKRQKRKRGWKGTNPKRFQEKRSRRRATPATKPESTAEPAKEPDEEWPLVVTTATMVPGFESCWHCRPVLTYGQASEESEPWVGCPKLYLGNGRWGLRRASRTEAGDCDGRGRPRKH